MDKKLNEIHDNLIPTKLITISHSTNSYNTIKHNIPYNWPAFLAVNNRYTFLYALIRIRYKGPHSNVYNIFFNLKWLYSLDS